LTLTSDDLESHISWMSRRP